MANKSNIKVENTVSFPENRVSNSEITFSSPAVKVKVENKFFVGEECAANDADNRLRETKMEKVEVASEDVTTCSDQFLDTNLLPKEKDGRMCLDLVKVKIEVEDELMSGEESGTIDPGKETKDIKEEEADISSKDAMSSAEKTSRCTSSSQFTDTRMLVKEEDLGICFEEEKVYAQDGLDSCNALEKDLRCGDKALTKTEMNEEADRFDRIEETAFSRDVDSKSNFSECERSEKVEDDASVLYNQRPFTCIICNARFWSKAELKAHVVTHPSERSFACTLCSSTFKLLSKLKRHLATHSNKRRYFCAHCSASFNTKCKIKLHVIMHLNKRPTNCPSCAQTFKRQYNLRRHMKSHSKKRSYKCQLCPATFVQRMDLKRHVITHSKEKRYVCTQCSARFNDKGYLRKHSFVHSKKKLLMSCILLALLWTDS